MGAQFGRWNFDRLATTAVFLDRVNALLSPYGPDGESRHQGRGVDLISYSFETTEQLLNRPATLESGEVLLWDGRLDNGSELLRAMGRPTTESDSEIVAATWSHWGQDCFARLIGDWALTLWNPAEQTLHLAVDILATRHIYYKAEPGCFEWCSVLDPLVLLSDRTLSLDKEFLAGWLASFPAAHLTAFSEIRRVPPASVVSIRHGSLTVRRYWDFDGHKGIEYKRDADYQEQFLELFSHSVRRRLRSACPVIAELSGGMDSSSIVCVADQITAATDGPQIDTVSYFNDREPHWNELPWFTKVETHRGKIGLHLDLNAQPTNGVQENSRFAGRPGASSERSPLLDFMRLHGHRVLLSGVGGDEFLGGVPTPLPELQDLLAQGRLVTLFRRLLAWALTQRRPLLHLFRETATAFLGKGAAAGGDSISCPSWLDPTFARHRRQFLAGRSRRLRWFGPSPSFQENMVALDGIRRQLATKDLARDYPYERRYPCLDRDLLDFLFAIPRDQLVRPGERRSLMRRALRGIVPEEILDRRRKAYVSRAFLIEASAEYESLSSKKRLQLDTLGVVAPGSFLDALRLAGEGMGSALMPLLRAVALEKWLDTLDLLGLLNEGEILGLPARSSSQGIEVAQV